MGPRIASGPGPRIAISRVPGAAAVAGRATHIVTHNLSDFPAARLAEHGVTVTDPDTYLCKRFGEFGDEVAATVARLAGEKRNPPMSTADRPVEPFCTA